MERRVLSVTAALILVASPGASAKEHVKTINGEAELDKFVASDTSTVVDFFAPWCGHCKKLEPEWEKAAMSLGKENPPIKLAKVDVTAEANKPLAQKYQVTGLPTIKFFKKGKVTKDYKGPRDAEGIVSHIKAKVQPSAKELTSMDAVADHLSQEVSVLAIFPKGEKNKQSMAAFKSAADEQNANEEVAVPFAFVASTELAPSEAGRVEAPTALLKKNSEFDRRMERWEERMEDNAAGLVDFVNDKSIPLLVTLDMTSSSQRNVKRMFEDKLPKLFAFHEGKEKFEDFARSIAETAKEREGQLRFILANATSNSRAMEHFGVTQESLPGLLVHDTESNAKYLGRNVAPEAVREWVERYTKGEVKKHLKSEPVPSEKEGTGATEEEKRWVRKVVAESFAEEVLRSEKNVLLEVMAEFCSHCKKLAPTYEKVARKYEEDEKVKVAAMDGSKNDLPAENVTVTGFPTIFLVTPSNDFIPFEGTRDEKGLVDFVEKNRLETASSSSSSSLSSDEL